MIFDFLFKKSETVPQKKNGKWKEFNKHAVLIAEGFYIDNKKHGVWREYYDSGELMIEESFHEDVPHGQYAAYHKNGVVLSEGKFIGGSREGLFKIYNSDGTHIKSLWFANDTLIAELEATNCSKLREEKSIEAFNIL